MLTLNSWVSSLFVIFFIEFFEALYKFKLTIFLTNFFHRCIFEFKFSINIDFSNIITHNYVFKEKKCEEELYNARRIEVILI